MKYYLIVFLYLIGIKKRKGTLFYLGLHKGKGFSQIFYRYKKCYGFEANPKLYQSLPKIIKWFPNVYIYNNVVADKDGLIQFNISSNNGASSSIGTFKKGWNNNIKMVETITVPSINLMRFIDREKIDFIDDYISDIQGFDLEVLKTLKPMIEQRRIGSITCETAKDEYLNIYDNAEDNSFTGFKNYLSDNYECVSKGWGILEDGVFNDVPEDWWEFDSKWKLKSSNQNYS
ncbi:MAG: FkbM family methyltransferase [Mangrovimonas sp.]|nr:FkbM family methyltransferase [Mangrovimonas sp.]MCB0434939.1 FkbM family methyltransferase [Mangrovimonas sp.]MCB0803997.1 FkbM family methyltransferase [Flavobacteriales bacterium]HPF97447.1 FkbM family methyltransferase [Mangrovimonas sp.]